MRPGQFYFNGINSLDYNMVIQHRPDRIGGEHNFTSSSATNRNGLIFRDEKTYNNGTLTLDIVFLNPEKDSYIDEVDELFDVQNYVDFESYYDPDYIYRVKPTKTPSFTNTRKDQRAVTFTLELSVYPFKFLSEGLKTTTYDGLVTLTNPTKYEAKPKITIRGTGDCTLTVNDITFHIFGLNGEYVLDSELLEEHGAGALQGLDFPTFIPGANTIYASTNDFDVLPRYNRRAV